MKKCLIVTPYRDLVGGVESVNVTLDSALTKIDFSVDYLTADDTNTFERFLRFVFGGQVVTALRFRNLKKDYELVICNGEYGFGIKHPNTVCLHHGSYLGYFKALRKYSNFKQKLLHLRGAMFQFLALYNKRNYAVSYFIKCLIEKQGRDVDCKILPNCIDDRVFFNKGLSRNRRVLYVGATNYYAKGIDVINLLVEKYGVPIDYASVTESDEVKANYIGCYGKRGMAELYNKYSCVILPSRFEGASMALLEAMACGTPVLTSAVGQGKEICSLSEIFVSQQNIAQEYAEKYKEILKDWDALSSICLEYIVQNHTFNTYCNYLEKLVDNDAVKL